MNNIKAKKFAMVALRRASLRWWARQAALKKAFIRQDGRKYIYKCAKCKGEFYRKEINVDHIKPVVDPNKESFTMDEFCDNLLCEPSGLQVLCITCHDIKTKNENVVRKQTKRETKREVTKKPRKSGTKKLGKSRLGRTNA